MIGSWTRRRMDCLGEGVQGAFLEFGSGGGGGGGAVANLCMRSMAMTSPTHYHLLSVYMLAAII